MIIRLLDKETFSTKMEQLVLSLSTNEVEDVSALIEAVSKNTASIDTINTNLVDNYMTLTGLNTKLGSYYLKSETYSKEEIDERIPETPIVFRDWRE